MMGQDVSCAVIVEKLLQVTSIYALIAIKLHGKAMLMLLIIYIICFW
jgi:hypothetical protein